MSNTIGAAYFKEHCLAILDTVTSDGVIITKHGQPVAKLIPIESAAGQLIGKLKDKIQIQSEDLFSTELEWDAES